MWLWLKVTIWAAGIIVALIVFIYFKMSFLAAASKGKQIRKGTKEEIGLFLCSMQYRWKQLLPYFAKDTFWVLVDTSVIALMIVAIIQKEWSWLFWIVLLRLILFDSLDGHKTRTRENFSKYIDRDLERYAKVQNKIREKSIK